MQNKFLRLPKQVPAFWPNSSKQKLLSTKIAQNTKNVLLSLSDKPSQDKQDLGNPRGGGGDSGNSENTDKDKMAFHD
jgi:hypothetical protein